MTNLVCNNVVNIDPGKVNRLMDTNHAVYTADYLLSVESVLRAGRRLQGSLNEDQPTVEYATTRLERAAEQHEAGATGYRTFMFSELEASQCLESCGFNFSASRAFIVR